MKYMMLIFEDEAITKQHAETKGFEAYMAEWFQYSEEMKQAGVMVGGEPLEESTMATTLSVRGGKREVQDGPFLSTKEQLGGFYIMDVPSLDEAMKWAEKCPAAGTGFLELRPVPDLGQ